MSHSARFSSILALLQLGDSAFPAGSFTHSYGLEQLVREGRLGDSHGVEGFVTSVLTHSISTSDAPAALGAALAAGARDLDSILDIDRRLYATRAASELRDASVQTGRRLLDEVACHVDEGMLDAYHDEVRRGAAPGTHPVVFGLTSDACGVAPRDVPAGLMLASVTAVLQAAMRLTRVSHRDVQGILHRLRPLIAALAEDMQGSMQPLQPAAFHPLQDIASMRHARAQARLFAS